MLHTASTAVKKEETRSEEDLYNLQVDILEEEISNMINEQPNTETIIKIKEKLKYLSLPVLSHFFQRLSNISSPLVRDRGILLNGITYLIQEKFYQKIFGFEISNTVSLRTKEMIRRCVHAVINE